MANPDVRAHEKLKRIARYLVGVKEVKWYFLWQTPEIDTLVVSMDSDWAGCRKTRRSTFGGCIMLGRHTLKTWSSTQATLAMSSAEAEYYALIEGAVRSLGLQSMMLESGLRTKIVLRTDSSAAKSYSSQRGLGRMRHLEVKDLWLQAAICRNRLSLAKVQGLENPAAFSRNISAARM